jgi:chromosome segregation ATPase
MEDEAQTPSTTTPPAARTAQALRELHDRARSALTAQRERMGKLEEQLTHQLDTIADTLAGQVADHGGTEFDGAAASEEVARLKAELEQIRNEWHAERDAWQAERSQLLAADNDRLQSMEAQQRELESRQVTLDERASELNHQDRELRQRTEQLDADAARFAEQQSQLTASEGALDKQRADVATGEAEIERLRGELEQARAAQSAHDSTVEEQQASLAAEREAIIADRAAFQLERVAFDAEREAFNEQVNAHSSAHAEGCDAETKLAEIEHLFNAERTAWERERTSVEEQRKLLAKERDDLTKALEAARSELTAAREVASSTAAQDELQQKLDLAAQETEQLRTQVAKLEQNLADRPAAEESDPLELVHLRAERDALAERITELEQQVAAGGEAGGGDDSELQRRLELAVDDVRDLKKRNAELESKLAAAASSGAAVIPAAGGGSSWEAMKLKMLANLEGEGDDVDEERVEQRQSIEDTIRATDHALAAKDREIEEIKSRLSEGTTAMADAEESLRELVDADEVIAGHRARVAKLEAEMQDKLRAAELEMSVERAKIARESAQLADLKAELESQRANHEVDSAAAAAGGGGGGAQQPKRRWLSKLGLSGDEPE